MPSLSVRRGCFFALFAATVLAVVVVPRPAHAQRYYVYEQSEPWARFNVGLDAEGAVPIHPPVPSSGNDLTGGGGFKVRLGEQLRFPLVRFVPEVGYGYDHLFATDDIGIAHDWDMHRIFAGARVGFGRVVVPGFYVHLGYGWRHTGDAVVGTASGLAFDGGFMLDVHVVPHFGFGAHAEYAMIDAQPFTPHWIALGLHCDIVF